MGQIKYQYEQIDLFGYKHCLFVAITSPMTLGELENHWLGIRNEIMMEHQNKIDDEFSRWNFYIFYVVKDLESLDGSLRYRIEHDMVSSRKILVDDENAKLESVVKRYIKYDVNPVSFGNNVVAPFEKSQNVIALIKSLRHEN